MKIHIKRSTAKKWQRAAKRTKQALRTGLRSIGRGLYFAVRGIGNTLMRLPTRTLWIGLGSISTVLLLVLVLALTLPGRAPTVASADAADTLAGPSINMTGPDAAILNQPGDLPGDVALGEPEPANGPDAADPADGADDAQAPEEGVIDLSNFTELSEGDDSEAVFTVQTRLMELGYMDSDEPTQHFGPLTERALKAFQAHNGLDDDGVCGLGTYTVLMSEGAKIYVMQSGDEGEDVEGVQQRLYELGYITSKSNITGTFGEKTQEAVMEFQKENKLSDDGKVGDKTLETLFSEDPVSKCFSIGDEDPIIKTVQTRLKKLGYFTGTASGEYTKATAKAVKKFQSVNDLVVDGQLGPTTKDVILSRDALANVIQLGDSGSDVTKMQKRLAELNYLRSANATGYFGEKTQEAVMAFQERNKLHSDGKIGSGTYSSLFSSSAKKARSASSSSASASGSGSATSGGSSASGGSSSSSGGSSSSGSSNSRGVEKLIEIAESKMGCKYVGGAKGPNTFDCSGFVYYCLKQSGVSVSYMTSIGWRSTSRFSKIGSLSDCKRGDILVFSGSSMSQGHVGIYLGGGKMIDAGSSSGCVRTTSTVLSGSYWPSHFLMAYRVF